MYQVIQEEYINNDFYEEFHPLRFLSSELSLDTEFIVKLLKIGYRRYNRSLIVDNYLFLESTNPLIFLELISVDVYVLSYAHYTLRNNRLFVLEYIRKGGSISGSSESLQNDSDIFIYYLRYNPYKIEITTIPETLRNDKIFLKQMLHYPIVESKLWDLLYYTSDESKTIRRLLWKLLKGMVRLCIMLVKN